MFTIKLINFIISLSSTSSGPVVDGLRLYYAVSAIPTSVYTSNSEPIETDRKSLARYRHNYSWFRTQIYIYIYNTMTRVSRNISIHLKRIQSYNFTAAVFSSHSPFDLIEWNY